jgi:hypothetical protein
VKSFLILNVLQISSYSETEKPRPQLGLPVIEELWLYLQKCREEICCQPLEAFAIKTSCISHQGENLSHHWFCFVHNKKKIPQNQRKEQCRESISTQRKKRKKKKKNPTFNL